MQRPDQFTLDPYHHLNNGLVFAGLGAMAGSKHYHDSSVMGRNCELVGGAEIYWGIDSGGKHVRLTGNATAEPNIKGTSFDLPSQFTVSMHIKRRTYNSYDGIIGCGGYNHGWCVYFSSSNTVRLTSTADASKNVTILDYTGDGFHHYVMLVENGYFRVYIDGVLKGSVAKATYSFTGDSPFRMGCRSAGDGTAEKPLNGHIRDALVYDRLLSPSEIQQLADPSNVMLSGLILPPTRKWWPVAATGTSCTLSGTVVDTAIDEDDITAGGKDIELTLTNDTWAAAGTGPVGSTADTQALIDGITGSLGAGAAYWDEAVRDNLVPADDVTRDSNVLVTIALPASAAYDISATETVTATVPAAVLVTSGDAVVASPTFTVDAVASGVLAGSLSLMGVGR